MAKKIMKYFCFTAKQCPRHIALNWFHHFRKKNMAALMTMYEVNGKLDYKVWVELDPIFYGEHTVPRSYKNIPVYGEVLYSCGGFRERLDKVTGELSSRIDYTTNPKCIVCGGCDFWKKKVGVETFKECSKCGHRMERE